MRNTSEQPIAEQASKLPPIVHAAAAVTALLSLWGVYEYARFESSYQQQFHDPYKVAAQYSRFEAPQAAVPENAALGYLTDLAPGSIVASTMFDGAQYVLAPRLLQQSTAYDLVLGNFSKPADFAALGRQHGLRVEHDFGDGVMLYRREAR